MSYSDLLAEYLLRRRLSNGNEESYQTKAVLQGQNEAETYAKTQQSLKSIYKAHMDSELVIYIRFIDVVLEGVRSKIAQNADYPLNYQAFEDYVFRKIHGIGLYDIIIPSPELTAMGLIQGKRKYMKQEFEKLLKQGGINDGNVCTT